MLSTNNLTYTYIDLRGMEPEANGPNGLQLLQKYFEKLK